MERIKEIREKKELLQLIEQMNGYQTELVLAFVVTLFGVDDDAEEAKLAA